MDLAHKILPSLHFHKRKEETTPHCRWRAECYLIIVRSGYTKRIYSILESILHGTKCSGLLILILILILIAILTLIAVALSYVRSPVRFRTTPK